MIIDVKKELAQELHPILNFSQAQIEKLLELPKAFEHGHLAMPVFILAKEAGKNPMQYSAELATLLKNKISFVEDVQSQGGFVNFKFTYNYLSEKMKQECLTQKEKLGYSKIGIGKNVVIDYSSPNIAKPMSIGHLRATVIGQAIRNLAETQGYNVIGVNHIGDWGVQFGKLAWAYKEWGHEVDFTEKPIEALLKLYVKFHDLAEQDPELDKLGSLTFKKLEDGDPEIKKIWQMFVDLSLKDYQRLYDLLGIKHEKVLGESFYNDKMPDIVQKLEEKHLLKDSEGAQVVFFDNDEMPPCLIKKSDGATLYATRDIACAVYRKEQLKADLSLYVVGVDQTLHFRQVFKVIEKMGYDWSGCMHHIAFGLYRFKDIGRMSTRKGNVIFFEDVINKAVELMGQIIEDKNPELTNKKEVASMVGVGAIIFNDLMNDRMKNVDFDWDKVLTFEGDSGPYVQYTYVRTQSLIRKYGKEIDWNAPMNLSTEEEKKLLYTLMHLKGLLKTSFEMFKPNLVAQYALEICKNFNGFYNKHRILTESSDVVNSRMLLVQMTALVLKQTLTVLNIKTPNEM